MPGPSNESCGDCYFFEPGGPRANDTGFCKFDNVPERMTVADWCGQYENKAEGLLTRNSLHNPLEIVVSEDELQAINEGATEVLREGLDDASPHKRPKKPRKPFKLPGTHPEDRTVPQLPDKGV